MTTEPQVQPDPSAQAAAPAQPDTPAPPAGSAPVEAPADAPVEAPADAGAPPADVQPAPIEQPAASAEVTAPPQAAAQDLSPAATGARLAALFPALFVGPGAPGPFKPIKLRIHADIAERAPGQFSKRVLGIFFSRYTTTTAYLKALAAPDAKRFDLDGQPAGEIAEEHRAAAAEELGRRQAIVAERRAAQRPAQAPQRREPAAGRGEPAHRGPSEDRPRQRPPHAKQRPARHDLPRRDRPSFDDAPAGRPQRPPRPVERAPAAEPAPVVPADPAQRERALLLRAFEGSPLSKANFCVLKRISESQLDAQLEQARAERAGRG